MGILLKKSEKNTFSFNETIKRSFAIHFYVGELALIIDYRSIFITSFPESIPWKMREKRIHSLRRKPTDVDFIERFEASTITANCFCAISAVDNTFFFK